MGQTIQVTLYHSDASGPVAVTVDAGSAFLTLLQSNAVVLGPVAATITPAGAATSHVLSYTLASPLPGGVVSGAAVARWARSEDGVSQGTFDVPVTIAGGSPPSIVGPTTLAWLQGNAWAIGDTYPPSAMLLGDASGPVDLSAALVIRFVSRPVSSSAALVNALAQTVPGQTGHAVYNWASQDLSVDGQHLTVVRVTWTDGTQTTFPSSDHALYSVSG